MAEANLIVYRMGKVTFHIGTVHVTKPVLCSQLAPKENSDHRVCPPRPRVRLASVYLIENETKHSSFAPGLSLAAAMAYPILPISAFIGALLVLIPLPSHWRARNYATISLVAWLFILDIIYGVNSAVWIDNVRIRLLVWCDISKHSFMRVSLSDEMLT